MNIAQRAVTAVLTDDGREVLKLAAIDLPESASVLFFVQDTDDLGLWIREPREDGQHLLLIRWEYVLTLDFPIGETKTIGLRS